MAQGLSGESSVMVEQNLERQGSMALVTQVPEALRLGCVQLASSSGSYYWSMTPESTGPSPDL